MKRYLALPLLLILVLCGCAAQTPPEAQTTPPAAEGPRALTQEEVDRVNEAFSPLVEQDGVTYATPVSCFFTCYYDDVKNINFSDFLYYFPGDGTLSVEDEAESNALKALPGYPWGNSPESVPIHRITRASVDQALERYAGITSADLDTSSVPYLEGYDAWYTFTSDFGPGCRLRPRLFCVYRRAGG